jgi:hypothetical protein
MKNRTIRIGDLPHRAAPADLKNLKKVFGGASCISADGSCCPHLGVVCCAQLECKHMGYDKYRCKAGNLQWA